MILYPTETIYALGVNALDHYELDKLYALKGRDSHKAMSWLVRTIDDIERYAIMSERAAKIAKRFLPGMLTLALPCKLSEQGNVHDTIGFRITTDPHAQKLIDSFMCTYDAPLTCTSANKSGMPTLGTPQEIIEQLEIIDLSDVEVIDAGPRTGIPTTVVRVIGDTVELLREGGIRMQDICSV
jgi:L-threonylcarbamoyladenylate synthase